MALKNWTIREASHKNLESYEMWRCRRMEISWTDHLRNGEVLHRGKEKRNILQTVERMEASWTGHIWRRNCLLRQVTEGKIEGRIEVTGRGGRRGKQLVDGLEENTGYCKQKREALDSTLWRTCSGKGYGTVVRPLNELMNK